MGISSGWIINIEVCGTFYHIEIKVVDCEISFLFEYFSLILLSLKFLFTLWLSCGLYVVVTLVLLILASCGLWALVVRVVIVS